MPRVTRMTFHDFQPHDPAVYDIRTAAGKIRAAGLPESLALRLFEGR